MLAYRHYCIGKDKLGDFGGFEYTPAAMDPISCGEMLDEVVNWFESKEGVDKITELYMEEIQEHAPDGPKLAGAVLDGDASTNALVPVVMQKAAAAGETRYCKEFKLMKCTNHLGKNTGKHAASIGHSLHKTCSCPANMTQKGEINKTQPKKHRGVNSDSHPLVKIYQRCTSAALRGARDWKKKPDYSDRTLSSLATQGVEEMLNHLTGVHDGPGIFTGERRVCRLHPITLDDGTPYQSRQYNDCADFNKGMASYLKANVIIDCIENVVHAERGAVCQNASERVGMVALKYRDKETPLKPTHYVCATGLVVSHVQNTVVHRFRRQLAEEGRVDDRIEQFGTFQGRLHQLIGLSYSTRVDEAWRKDAAKRAKRSCMRATVSYKRKRKHQRAEQTKQRAAQKTDHRYRYKGSTGGRGSRSGAAGASGAAAASKGAVGACKCTGMCMRGCPCKAAHTACTSACHHGRPCQNNGGGSSSAARAPHPAAKEARTVPTCPPITDDLIGCRIRYRFDDGIDWMEGEICELDEDGADNEPPWDEVLDCEANYLVYYEADDSDVPRTVWTPNSTTPRWTHLSALGILSRRKRRERGRRGGRRLGRGTEHVPGVWGGCTVHGRAWQAPPRFVITRRQHEIAFRHAFRCTFWLCVCSKECFEVDVFFRCMMLKLCGSIIHTHHAFRIRFFQDFMSISKRCRSEASPAFTFLASARRSTKINEL